MKTQRTCLPLRRLFNPVQIALTPGIDQANRQDGKKHDHVNEDVSASPLEYDSPGKDEDRFNIEDQKDQSNNVKARIETDKARPLRGLTAFVGGEFQCIG
jgi:hypothetical protein